MVQVKGIWRLLTERFSRDFASRVKYSTLCPSRIDSPSEAIRAMPTSRGLSESGSKGRMDILIRLFFAIVRRAAVPVNQALGQYLSGKIRLPLPIRADFDFAIPARPRMGLVSAFMGASEATPAERKGG